MSEGFPLSVLVAIVKQTGGGWRGCASSDDSYAKKSVKRHRRVNVGDHSRRGHIDSCSSDLAHSEARLVRRRFGSAVLPVPLLRRPSFRRRQL